MSQCHNKSIKGTLAHIHFNLFHKIQIFEYWFRSDQIFGVIAGDGNGLDFTFLLTFSSLFWCAGQKFQNFNIVEAIKSLHLPDLESRELDSIHFPRKCQNSRRNAVHLGFLVHNFCRALFYCIYFCNLQLDVCNLT